MTGQINEGGGQRGPGTFSIQHQVGCHIQAACHDPHLHPPELCSFANAGEKQTHIGLES